MEIETSCQHRIRTGGRAGGFIKLINSFDLQFVFARLRITILPRDKRQNPKIKNAIILCSNYLKSAFKHYQFFNVHKPNFQNSFEINTIKS